jgi:hypothetical protein
VRVASCDTRRLRLTVGDGMAEQVGYVVRVDIRRAESRRERMSKVMKVEIRKTCRLNGCLKVGHQLAAFPTHALRIKDAFPVLRVLTQTPQDFKSPLR